MSRPQRYSLAGCRADGFQGLSLPAIGKRRQCLQKTTRVGIPIEQAFRNFECAFLHSIQAIDVIDELDNRPKQRPDIAFNDEMCLQPIRDPVESRFDGSDRHAREYVIEGLELETAAYLLRDQSNARSPALLSQIIDEATKDDPGKSRL